LNIKLALQFWNGGDLRVVVIGNHLTANCVSKFLVFAAEKVILDLIQL
jgi:hypothetical protein